MDPLASLALTATLTAVLFYVLYWVVRRAVAGGIRDAREQSVDPAGEQKDAPEVG